MLMMTLPAFLILPLSLLMSKNEKRAPRRDVGSDMAEKLRKAVRDRDYIYLMIGFFTCGFHMALITNHLPTQIQSFGFSSDEAAFAFSIYGVTTIVGSVLSGSLCGKYKMNKVLGFFYGLRPLTVLCFLLAPKTLASVNIFAALFGFSGAATVPPVSGIIARDYGAGSIATLFGLVFFIHQIGGFFGAWLGGVNFESTGGYTEIWAVGVAFSIAAAAISFAISEDGGVRPRESVTEAA